MSYDDCIRSPDNSHNTEPLTAEQAQTGACVSYESRPYKTLTGGILTTGHPGRVTLDDKWHTCVDWFGLEDDDISLCAGMFLEQPCFDVGIITAQEYREKVQVLKAQGYTQRETGWAGRQRPLPD